MSEETSEKSIDQNLLINNFLNTYSEWNKEFNNLNLYEEPLDTRLKSPVSINLVVKQKVKVKILIKDIIYVQTDEKAERTLSLEQMLKADDFFDFLNSEKQKELEKVLDVR